MRNSLILSIRVCIRILLDIGYSKLLIYSIGLSGIGLNSVIQNIIVFIAILNTPLGDMSQRYFNTVATQKSEQEFSKLYSNLILCGIVISFLAFVFGTCFYILGGLNTINFTKNQQILVHILFWSTLFSAAIKAVQVPINACIASKNNFISLAIISLTEGIIRVCILALGIYMRSKNNLLPIENFVGIAIIASSISSFLFSIFTSKQYFLLIKRSQMSFLFIKGLLNFTTFALVLSICNLSKDALVSIATNKAFGSEINGLYTVPMQIFAGVSGLMISITFPFTNKIYFNLSHSSTTLLNKKYISYNRFIFLSVFTAVCPLVLFKKLLLRWWLGEDIPAILIICDMYLFTVLFDSISILSMDSVKCKGDFRSMFIIESLLILASCFLTTFFIFKFHFLYSQVLFCLLLSIARYLERSYLASKVGISRKLSYRHIYFPSLALSSTPFLIFFVSNQFFRENFTSFIFLIFSCLILASASVFSILKLRQDLD